MAPAKVHLHLPLALATWRGRSSNAALAGTGKSMPRRAAPHRNGSPSATATSRRLPSRIARHCLRRRARRTKFLGRGLPPSPRQNSRRECGRLRCRVRAGASMSSLHAGRPQIRRDRPRCGDTNATTPSPSRHDPSVQIVMSCSSPESHGTAQPLDEAVLEFLSSLEKHHPLV